MWCNQGENAIYYTKHTDSWVQPATHLSDRLCKPAELADLILNFFLRCKQTQIQNSHNVVQRMTNVVYCRCYRMLTVLIPIAINLISFVYPPHPLPVPCIMATFCALSSLLYLKWVLEHLYFILNYRFFLLVFSNLEWQVMWLFWKISFAVLLLKQCWRSSCLLWFWAEFFLPLLFFFRKLDNNFLW